MKIKIMKSGDDFWPRPTNVVVRFDSIGDKVFVTLGNSVVLHTLTGCVPEHRDCMSKSVYLMAIHASDKTRFTIDDGTRYGKEMAFKTGYAIKFNDYNTHGVYVPPRARRILISVDT